MVTKLHPDEINQLKKFRLAVVKGDSTTTLPLKELLCDDNISAFLTKLKVKVNAPDNKVTASMFAKRYGFFAVLCLYSMTILNKRLDTSIENVSLEMEDENQVWLPKFQFAKLSGTSSDDVNRDVWRDDTIKAIFAKHINLIIDSLAKETKLPKLILWENIAIYIFWLYENLVDDPSLDKNRKLLEEDFEYVVHKAPGKLFGDYHRNPLTRYYTKKTFDQSSQKEVRIRKTCCFFYKTTENEDRCLTCPTSCKF